VYSLKCARVNAKFEGFGVACDISTELESSLGASWGHRVRTVFSSSSVNFPNAQNTLSLIRTRSIACAAWYVYFSTEIRKTTRKIWVKKWRQDRYRYGHMLLLRELRENDLEDFKNYLRMDNSTFEYILNLISPYSNEETYKSRRTFVSHSSFFGVLHIPTVSLL
jgi:hypothetical protein